MFQMTNQSKVLSWSLIVGIFIVLNLFFNYTISLFYTEPKYEDFCPMTQVVTMPETQDECVAKGGQWTDNAYYKPGTPSTVSPEVRGYCDLQYTCRHNYDTAQETYSRNIFIILVLLGALSVLAGNFLKGNYVISSGLALGGVLSFIIASMRYWSAADNLIRVVILAIALMILFWIAMKKFNERLQSEGNRS